MDFKIKLPHIISIIFIFTFITLYLASSLNTINAQNIVIQEDKPFISVIGQAEKEVSPDQTKISLAFENTAANTNLARKSNADKMNNVLSILKSNGLTNENLSTSNFEIKPNYDVQNNNYNKIISYTAVNSILIITSANANISKFIDLAINNGANRVENVDFVSSQRTLNTTFNELLKDAYSNAKEKAETLSTEGGFSINGVKKIEMNQDNLNSYNTLDRNSFTMEKSPSSSTPIIPQNNKITITLPVSFYIINQNYTGENK